MDWNIQNKTVLITGATDGIGKEVSRELLRRGANVVAVAHTKEKGEVYKAAFPDSDYIVADLASLAGVRSCAEAFAHTHNELHVLINNAGVMPATKMMSADAIELNMAVNYFAPVLLTELLLPLLKRSAPARIINVASTMHRKGHLDPDNLESTDAFDRYRSYANSKLALMLYTQHLARVLRGSGVTVNALHPGWIKTKLALGTVSASGILSRALNPFRMSSSKEGAKTVVYLAAKPDVAQYSGKYFTDERIVEPSRDALDETLADEVWAKTLTTLRAYL
ncbi:MAG: SDR family NAD(P)-dependent oxidoreductase [Patescibacteria group bacterium]